MQHHRLSRQIALAPNSSLRALFHSFRVALDCLALGLLCVSSLPLVTGRPSNTAGSFSSAICLADPGCNSEKLPLPSATGLPLNPSPPSLASLSFLSLLHNLWFPALCPLRNQFSFSFVCRKETQCLVTKGRYGSSGSWQSVLGNDLYLSVYTQNISLLRPVRCAQISGDKTFRPLFSFGSPHALT